MGRKTHKCPSNDVPEITILDGSSLDGNWEGWVLVNKFIATEQDVKAGEAESVGEELSCSLIAIQFCPFCGVELNKHE